MKSKLLVILNVFPLKFHKHEFTDLSLETCILIKEH